MAYFRGARTVTLEDIRQILPFVLHDKLQPDADSQFFETPGNETFRVDRNSWIRRMFDLSCAEYERLDLDRVDPVRDIASEMRTRIGGGNGCRSQNSTRKNRTTIERLEQRAKTLWKSLRRHFETQISAPALHKLFVMAKMESAWQQ